MASELLRIPPSAYDVVVPDVLVMLSEAADATGGRFSTDDIVVGLLQGLTQLWVWYDDNTATALAITEINQYPQLKAVNIFAVAGKDHKKWLRESLRQIEEWAVTMQATRVELSCRTGWERLLKPLDYKRTYVLLEKPLGDQIKTTDADADDGAVEARDPVSDERPRTG